MSPVSARSVLEMSYYMAVRTKGLISGEVSRGSHSKKCCGQNITLTLPYNNFMLPIYNEEVDSGFLRQSETGGLGAWVMEALCEEPEPL